MKNKDILVIEDNDLNRKLVRALLQKSAYNILEAVDAESGILLAREHRPGLVLMDIQLPGMDGLSATRIIKQDPGLREIPVVALTAHAMEGDREKAMEAGCAGYISKPFRIKDFLDAIQKFFPDGHEGKLPVEEAIGGKKRILIVDDDPLNVKLLATKLPNKQYEVFSANSGHEALKKLEQASIDLILLDIIMPGMDGYEVARRIKKDPKTSEIPIIFITALEGTEETIKGLEAGADEFLNKPVSTLELLSRMRSLIHFKQCQEQCTLHTQSQAAFKIGEQKQESFEAKAVTPSILLVEDNPKEAQMIRQYLNGLSFQVDIVGDGEEALARVDKGQIDLILLDILLPGIDGFEVCRRLKARPLMRNSQILVMTCLSDLESKIKGLEIGADDFLVKPIKPQELKVRVQALVRRKACLDRLHGNYEGAFQDAITDKKTGLYNRAYFKYFCELEMEKSLRQWYPLSLIMMHIDDLHAANSTLGNLPGDGLLKEFGQLIKSTFREVDFAARYEGEKFAILSPYMDGSSTAQMAERVKQVINAHPFGEGTAWASRRLTVSMGVAEFSRNLPDTEDLIRKADEALQLLKKEGVNPVCIHDNHLSG